MVDAGEIGLPCDGVVSIELHEVGILAGHFSPALCQAPGGKGPRQVFVQMCVVLVIGVAAPYREVLDRGKGECERLGVRPAPALVYRLFYGDVGIVERGTLAVVVKVVDLRVYSQHRGDVNRARPYSGSAYVRLVVIVVTVEHVGVVVHLEPFGKAVAKVQAGDNALGARIEDYSLVVGIGDRCEVVGGLGIARDRQRMLLEGGRAGNGPEPVGARPKRFRVGVLLRVARGRRVYEAVAGGLAEIYAVVVIGGELGGVHVVEAAGEL